MGKRIIGITLAVVGFLLFYIIAGNKGHFIPYPYPIVVQILCNAIGIFGIYLAAKGYSYKDLKARNKFNAFKKDLMENGEMISVDLSKCEIKENNYSVEGDNDYEFQIGGIDTQLLDSIYDNDRATKSVEIDQTRLIFSYIHNGIYEKYISPIIPRTADDLRIKIFLHKTTSLYVDKNDRKRYYFDMSFLKREE